MSDGLLNIVVVPLFPPTEGVTFRIAEAKPHRTHGGDQALRVTFEAIDVPDDKALVGRRITQTVMLAGKGAVFAKPLLVAAGIIDNDGGKIAFKIVDLISKSVVADVTHHSWQGADFERLTNFRAEIDTTAHEFTLG